MRRRRHDWFAALAAALIASLAVVPATAPSAVADDDGAPTSVSRAVTALLDGAGVASYWTPERMAAAVPLDLGPDGDRLAASSGSSPARAGLTAPRSVGKLFFSDSLVDYVCSAATLNTPSRDLIITAGHCVNQGGQPTLLGLGGCSAGDTFENFLFVPRYASGAAPDGEWVGTRAIMHSEWVEQCDAFAYDNALIELAPRNGSKIVDVVGGNGLALDFPPTQHGVRIWGWPAEAPYDGETAQRCAGNSGVYADTGTDAALACDMTGGASGGPWFVSMATSQLGFIWAVTSRRTLGGTPYLLAEPLTRDVLTLLTTSGLTRPGVVSTSDRALTTISSSRPGLALRATPARVGRGQGLTLKVRSRARTAVSLSVRTLPSGTWRRIAVGRTDGSGVFVVRSSALRLVGVREYRVQALRRSVSVRVRVLSCPMPLDPTVADDTACTRPSA